MQSRRIPVFLLALVLALATCAPSRVMANVLDVPLVGQEQTNWCWAANVKCIFDYYGKTVDQAHIATKACRAAGWCSACDCWTYPTNTTCCNRPNDLYHPGGGHGTIQHLMEIWGFVAWAGPYVLEYDSVKREINDDRTPFIIRWGWSGDGGHFIVAHGVGGSNETNGTVYYMNPLPVNEGKFHVKLYSWVLSNRYHTWDYSLTMGTEYPRSNRAVLPDGSGFYPTIQSAIDASQDNDTVSLFNGTYKGAGNKNLDFDGKAIVLRSFVNNADRCTLDCEGSGPAISFYGENAGAIVQALTIVNGHNSGGDGGAITCMNASPTIRNCKLIGNSATYHGGALYCYNSSPTLISCTVNENTAGMKGGGVFYFYTGCQPALINCTFANNWADEDGGAVGGYHHEEQPARRVAIVRNCTFRDNTALLGGGAMYFFKDFRPHISKCTIVRNSAIQGGGLSCRDDCGPKILSSTFADNSASSIGGGMYLNQNSVGTIDNTIVAFSTQGAAIHCQNSSTPDLTCCDLYGNAGGDWVGDFSGQQGSDGNICQDPRFCRSQNPSRPYSLNAMSPCTAGSNPDCGQIGDWSTGCGFVPYPPGGGFIVHHVAGVDYSAGQDWCQRYDDEFSLPNCNGQLNRIDTGGKGASVWYVLAAWGDEGPWEWCGTTFGFGGYDDMIYYFMEWDSCYPDQGLELPTAGWPGPNEGTAMVVSGGFLPWSGDFTPVYWFAGYAYDAGVIPLGEHPGTGFAGISDCNMPPIDWPAECLGAMGIFTDGTYCCPDSYAESRACCLAGGECMILTEPDCLDLEGEWNREWHTCEPNPCPQPTAVCCVEDDCYIMSEAACIDLEGEWHADWSTCQPNPCAPPLDFADHDIGDCVLTVTDQGSLGFMSGEQAQGSGFIYPLDGSNLLYIGGLWVGESETYVANRDYDDDPAREWIVTTDPDGHIWLDMDGTSQLDIHAGYSDALAAQPRDLFVDQESWSFGGDAADDFVILRFHVENRGGQPLDDLYIGLFLDFDLGTSMVDDEGRVDAGHNLVYMFDPDGTHAGLQLLQDEYGDPPPSNLTLVHNRIFVWEDRYVLDEDKYRFLSAAGPEYVLTESAEPDDYSLVAAAGPFDLAPGGAQLVALAILGAESLEDLEQNAYVAQTVYVDGLQDTPWGWEPLPRVTRLLPTVPNPFERSTLIGFDLSCAGNVELALYDITGRRLRTLAGGWHPAMRYVLTWDGRDSGGRAVPGGVYFLRLDTQQKRESRRVIRIK